MENNIVPNSIQMQMNLIFLMVFAKCLEFYWQIRRVSARVSASITLCHYYLLLFVVF